MTLYTFQPQSLIDRIDSEGIVVAEMDKTNLQKHMDIGGNPATVEAYLWMARKLSEKTGLWFKDAYGEYPDIPTDADGDYIDEDGRKLPVLPFWCWYMTDGKKQKPDRAYSFDRTSDSDETYWNVDTGETRLLTMEVPDDLVLLSDANAWYCVLESRPCYEYEENEDELLEAYGRKMAHFKTIMADPDRLGEARMLAEEIYDETIGSWDNIFRLEGRRLRSFMLIDETYDVQAVIPFIHKDWVVSVE